MRTSWKVEDFPESTTISVELHVETLIDKTLPESIGTVTTATIKKNGSLQFVINVPRQPLPKPLQDRGKDDVRDS